MTQGTEWLELRTCGECGKRFTVLYPHLWRYKRKPKGAAIYFCSYSCVRKFDREGVENMGERRNRIEIAKTIIEMGKKGQGGAPVMKYLTELGYKNPVQAVTDIKKYIREKDPDLYAQWPMWHQGKMTTIGEMIYETPQEAHMAPPREPITNIEVPVKNPNDIFEEIEIRSVDSGMIYRRSETGAMVMIMEGKTIFMSGKKWMKLAEEIPKALKKMEVEI